MYFKLNDNVGIRKYADIGYCFTCVGSATIYNIEEKEYFLLKYQCDGQHDIEVDDYITRFYNEGVIVECERGEYPRTKWQDVSTDTMYVPEIELAITHKCNLNCIYCFQTKDNSVFNCEMSLEDIERVLDQTVECGTNLISITGGEPLVHKDLYKVIDAIYDRQLVIKDVMTNGTLITKELLDYIKSKQGLPLFNISFDGIGTHDFVRGGKTEDKVIDSIKLCVDNGFRVKISANMNKHTGSSLYETVKLSEELGCEEFRLIRTSPGVLWRENNQMGNEYSHNEWFDMACDFLEKYTSEEHTMIIDFWSVYGIHPREKYINISPIKECNGKEHNLCDLIKERMCIGADGEVVPCHQFSGVLKSRGETLGNCLETDLKSILTQSKWLEWVTINAKERLKHNECCKTCEYWQYCQGGCPIWGWTTDQQLPYGLDDSKCVFFKQDYYHKLLNKLQIGWRI